MNPLSHFVWLIDMLSIMTQVTCQNQCNCLFSFLFFKINWMLKKYSILWLIATDIGQVKWSFWMPSSIFFLLFLACHVTTTHLKMLHLNDIQAPLFVSVSSLVFRECVYVSSRRLILGSVQNCTTLPAWTPLVKKISLLSQCTAGTLGQEWAFSGFEKMREGEKDRKRNG